MVEMKLNTVVVRFEGEIGIKGRWTRRSFENLLLVNIRRFLKYNKIPYNKILKKHGRIFIQTTDAEYAAEKLAQVFGISSISPAVEISSENNQIIRNSLELADDVLTDGCSFAVRCRRAGNHPYSSMEICRDVGEQVLLGLKDRNLRVDLENPQKTLEIEVRDDRAYLFSKTISGEGGFPVGSQDKIVCLLSGGTDSPVAFWLMMKRGCPVIPAYFDTTPFTDEDAKARVIDISKKLYNWAVGYPRMLYLVPHGANLKFFIDNAPLRLTCILCKRLMYRIAERIAEIENAEGIVTGDAIGQQASQTLRNLRVLNQVVTNYPIHRPLLSFNKLEIEKIARNIGTFNIAKRKPTYCGAAPRKPVTRVKLGDVQNAEREIDIESMVTKAIGKTEFMVL
jgi:thiamine biosynthesis protein ThiI